MIKIKYTKSALRKEEKKFLQLENYLPTLQLKKKLLQVEINANKAFLKKLNEDFEKKKSFIEEFVYLIDEDLLEDCVIKHVEKTYQNIAGVEIPQFKGVLFDNKNKLLFERPIWWEKTVFFVKELMSIKQNILVQKEKRAALLKELKEVSIRVNLFEKILIPRTLKNIKKIKIFLSDQELAFISRSKIAKNKILARR